MIWNYAKCLSLSNQNCMTQPIHINLRSNEYSQKFHYYPLAAKLDRCVESCSTLNDLSNKVCVSNMCSRRFKSCGCKCKFDGRKCNSNQKWNNDKYQLSVKIIYVKRLYLENCYM